MLIGELKLGQRARIIGFKKENSAYKQKLLAMGLVPGVEFSILQKAPLGCPVLISFRGGELALRVHEARILSVEAL
jgi:ferrous iron transport protein A